MSRLLLLLDDCHVKGAMRRLLICTSWLGFALGLLWPSVVSAQEAGIVEGIVRVGGGGTLPASIRVVLIGAGLEGRTEESGRFRIEAVPPGSYELEVEEADWSGCANATAG